MTIRSWLMVAGSDDSCLGQSIGTGADVIIVDLEDSVPLDLKRSARVLATDWLAAHRQTLTGQRRMGRWVRINALDTAMWRDDLIAVMPAAPDGIILPKAAGPEAVRQLAAELYELEQRNRIPANSTRIIPLVGETAHSAMTISSFLGTGHQRLAGLGWGAQELAASVSATACFDKERGWYDIFRFVRAQTLLTAHASGILAIDAAYGDLGDTSGLAGIARTSRAEGFSGMMAIHPDQVPIINEAFTPSGEELQEARDIVAAFEESPSSGVLQFRGRMIDRPHLNLARQMIGVSEGSKSGGLARTSILRPA